MNTATIWTGGCLCGSRRYEFRGDPPHSGYCHCNMCKRATGGAFAVLVQARRDMFNGRKSSPQPIDRLQSRRVASARTAVVRFSCNMTTTSLSASPRAHSTNPQTFFQLATMVWKADLPV